VHFGQVGLAYLEPQDFVALHAQPQDFYNQLTFNVPVVKNDNTPASPIFLPAAKILGRLLLDIHLTTGFTRGY